MQKAAPSLDLPEMSANEDMQQNVNFPIRPDSYGMRPPSSRISGMGMMRGLKTTGSQAQEMPCLAKYF